MRFGFLALAFLLACSTATPDDQAPFDWCLTDAPPDDACYRQKRDLSSASVALALDIARKQMAERPASSLQWRWEEAVMMVSFGDLYRLTGDQELGAYLKEWIDHHLEAGYWITSSDTCTPAVTAMLLYQESGDAAYRKVVDDVLHYLYDVALRTEEGAINHLGELDILGVTVWVDSLFMFGTTLLRWGDAQDDTQALDEFSFQYRVFADLLQEESGFFFHAYQWNLPQDDGIYWARGNGWVTAAAGEYLRVRALRGERDDEVLDSLKRQVAAAISTQDQDSGLWWTVLNRPGETYLETSAAALFAYGMARAWRIGLLGDEVLPTVRQAMDGVRSMIVVGDDGKPTVTGTSGPTTAGTFEQYSRVPVKDDIAYGIGAVILALIETSGLPE
jgi:unsaturated rhamnogalacturonyl hydrolase